MLRIATLALSLLAGCATVEPSRVDKPAAAYRVYVGTYTQGGASKGIYRFDLDASTGKTTAPVLAAEATNPSFLALHPDGSRLYAVGEIGQFQGQSAGSVSAYAIGPTGDLTPLNSQGSGGGGPCHLTVDRAGKNVLVANYGGGSAACLPITPDGKLSPATSIVQHTGKGPNAQRQEAPHAHSVNLSPDGKVAFVADLGLDRVMLYDFDAEKGTLAPSTPASASVPPGGGPRHFDLHPTGLFAYANNEMTSAVTAFRWDGSKQTLEPVQTVSTLPANYTQPGNSTAETRVHPSGKFLYVSNRGHDSIAIFRISEGSGELTPAGHAPTLGKTPRNFNITPDGRWLLAANQDSDTFVVFEVNTSTGQLTPTGSPIPVSRPVCVKFLPIGK